MAAATSPASPRFTAHAGADTSIPDDIAATRPIPLGLTNCNCWTYEKIAQLAGNLLALVGAVALFILMAVVAAAAAIACGYAWMKGASPVLPSLVMFLAILTIGRRQITALVNYLIERVFGEDPPTTGLETLRL